MIDLDVLQKSNPAATLQGIWRLATQPLTLEETDGKLLQARWFAIFVSLVAGNSSNSGCVGRLIGCM